MPWTLLSDKCLVVDLETTGFSPTNDEIIEVGIVEVQSGEIVDVWSSMVHADKPIPAVVTRVHGITNDMLMLASSKAVVKKELMKRLDGCLLIEHSQSGFDTSFLRSFLGTQIWKATLNTLHLSRKLLPECSKFDLATLCCHASISLDDHHRAQADALATAELFLFLVEKAKGSYRCREDLASLFGVKGV